MNSRPAPVLQNDERALVSEGVPLVVHERPGAADRPLTVFLPGAIHLARVAYGHEGSRPEDFLAHWFERAGQTFVAVSYPLDVAQPAFQEVDAHLGLGALAEAIAALARTLVDEWGLGQQVMVLGWSAAGNIAPRLRRAMAEYDLDLSLFVGLAATPAIPNLVFGSLDNSDRWSVSPEAFTADGLIAHRGLRSFLPELEQTDGRYGRVVIPADVYNERYVGDMPLNLFPGLGVWLEGNRFEVGHEPTLAESLGAEWADYPVVASLQPTWRSDARHAVTDRQNWGMALVNMLSARHLTGADLETIDNDSWHRVIEVINRAPSDLNRTIEGGHLFFVGVDGARQTADAALELWESATGLTELLGSLLEGS